MADVFLFIAEGTNYTISGTNISVPSDLFTQSEVTQYLINRTVVSEDVCKMFYQPNYDPSDFEEGYISEWFGDMAYYMSGFSYVNWNTWDWEDSPSLALLSGVTSVTFSTIPSTITYDHVYAIIFTPIIRTRITKLVNDGKEYLVWNVDSINWKVGQVTVNEVPTVGSNWQVLTVVSGNPAWSNAPVTSVNGNTWAVTVDESVVSGDAWVTYTIKVSNSDPASWTASNIITLVQ